MSLAPLRRAIAARPSLRFVARVEPGRAPVPARRIWTRCAAVGLAFGELESGLYLAWRRFGQPAVVHELWVIWY
jgi:hypothetical protein